MTYDPNQYGNNPYNQGGNNGPGPQGPGDPNFGAQGNQGYGNYGGGQPGYGQQNYSYGGGQPGYGQGNFGGPGGPGGPSGPGGPAGPGGYGGGANPLDIGSVFSGAWNGFKNNLGPWLVLGVATFILSLIVNAPNFANGGISFETSTTTGTETSGNFGLSMLTLLIGAIVGFFLMNVAYQGALRTVDGERMSIGDFFKLRNPGPNLVTYLAVIGIAIVCTVVIIIGWIVGIVLFVLLYFCLIASVDTGAGVGASFKSSIAIVRENVGTCLGVGVLFALLSIVSIITLGLASIVISPLMYIATAWIYRAAGGGQVQQQNYIPQPDYPQNF